MLNILVVYTDRIPFYKEHFDQMTNSGITFHGTDCLLVLGQEYNEDVTGFSEKSVFRHTNVTVFPFDDEPDYKQTYNDTNERTKQLNNYYKSKAADNLEEGTNFYGIVIYTHTNVLNIPKIDWRLLYEETLDNNCLYVNRDRTFVCGSKSNMIKYLQNTSPNLNIP